MKEPIQTHKAPKAIGAYSQAIKSGEFDPFGGKFTTGELLGMNKYLEGIDAQVPN